MSSIVVPSSNKPAIKTGVREMKSILLDILVCPGCRNDVDLIGEVFEGQEVVSGLLKCRGCQESFRIIDGVPCMFLDSSVSCSTQKAFSEQWELRQSGGFKIKHQYGLDYNKWINYIEGKGLIDCEKDEWALDAGCGSGELTYSFAERNSDVQVIGMDFQNDIYRSASQAKDYPNIHFVHGDVMNPPFRRESIKLLMSHGVLHHTSDTKKAFDSVSSLVKNNGKMSIWLYPHPSEAGPVMKYLYFTRDLLFAGRGHLLSSQLRLKYSRLCTVLCFPLFLLVGSLEIINLKLKCYLSKGKSVKAEDALPLADFVGLGEFFRAQVFLQYDTITPEFQFRHRREEVLNWFANNYFVNSHSDTYNPGFYYGVKQ